jgi:SAM-dependent methyltransferase
MNAHAGTAAASAWVVRWLDRLAPGTTLLDLACGTGRHAAAGLARGLRVTAVDRDAAALALVPVAAERCAADLEQGRWPLGERRFDAIVVANYLHRPLFEALAAALNPGGLLIYETFAIGNARYGRPANPDFLLRPGELYDAWAGRLHILAFEDGYVARPRPARVQRLAAVRMPAGEADPLLLERYAL